MGSRLAGAVALASGPLGVHDAGGAMRDGLILGLDPGRGKTGFAFVNAAGELLFSGIFPSDEGPLFRSALREARCRAFVPWLRESPCFASCSGKGRFALSLIVLGSGTGSRELKKDLEQEPGPERGTGLCEILVVDERGTTLEARGLYWRLHRPAWWQRLLPQGLRLPPRPLDDLAAWGIAMRGLNLKLK